jgi:integrase/recombinase XerC
MIKVGLFQHYANAERQCPICNDPLPEHTTWPGARYRFCGRTVCAAQVKLLKSGRFVDECSEYCHAPGCSKFVPQGRYTGKFRFIACSPDCYRRRQLDGSIRLTCGCGCGGQVRRASNGRKGRSGRVFLSREHRDEYRRNTFLSETCGVFLPIMEEYLHGFAATRYRDMRTARKSLPRFFLFLNEQGIQSLEDVSPRTISGFISWIAGTDRKLSTSCMSTISVFFKWASSVELRSGGNPVVGMIHRAPRKKRLPRPYKKQELVTIWELLNQRGNARLRFAAAVAEESGLRISEICRLRLEDVDLTGQRLFVRLPNKTMTERWAFFSTKTARFFKEWMVERDPKIGHNHVITSITGGISSAQSLHEEFQRALCKTYHGQTVHETGLDRWSTHRLRHTMASNLASAGADLATVMAACGWVNTDSMAGYVEIPVEHARRGYEEAMRRAREEKVSAPMTRVLTPAELLRRRPVKVVKQLLSATSAHCV